MLHPLDSNPYASAARCNNSCIPVKQVPASFLIMKTSLKVSNVKLSNILILCQRNKSKDKSLESFLQICNILCRLEILSTFGKNNLFSKLKTFPGRGTKITPQTHIYRKSSIRSRTLIQDYSIRGRTIYANTSPWYYTIVTFLMFWGS